MERHLSLIEKELVMSKIPIIEPDELIHAPSMKEEWLMEAMLEKLVHEITEVSQTMIDLKQTYYELTELRQVLKKTQQFYDDDVMYTYIFL